jgi:hypothetical protein
MFDALIELYPSIKSHSSPRKSIAKTVIHSPDFENGILKLLRRKEGDLVELEKQSLRRFEKERVDNAPEAENRESRPRVLLALEAEALTQSIADRYVDVSGITPNSNHCELSQAKLILSPQRQSLLPETVKMLLVLKLLCTNVGKSILLGDH